MAEKLFILTYTIFVVLIVVSAACYIKLALIDENKIEFFTKWIPCALLSLHSGGWTIIYRLRLETNMLIFSLLCTMANIFCLVGDIILIIPDGTPFLVGMMVFLIAYILFGSARINDILAYLKLYVCSRYLEGGRKIIFLKLALPLTLIFAAGIVGLVYSLVLMVGGNVFYGRTLVFPSIIYFLGMMYAVSTHLANLFFYKKISSAISFVGILFLVVSDFLIILHDFRYNELHLEILVMVIYWSGLVMINWSVGEKDENDIHIIYRPFSNDLGN
ncbi:MAG: lysoplasmalogenase family protein [Nitrososphaerota archaeon]